MAKPTQSVEKRRREQAKRLKREEKAKRKADRKAGLLDQPDSENENPAGDENEVDDESSTDSPEADSGLA
ncbi:MAG: hypothetical protein AAF517_10340 [Planctomycetota bacterium]